MDSTTLQLHIPPGTTKTNRQGRRPGKIACRACHARKKRCDISPPYHQCTHCRKENQRCIPRDPIERSTRHRITNRNHNRNTSQTTIHTNENTNCQFKKSKSPQPVIHHGIPHWSALYSFYSEVSRLLPCSFSTSPCPSSEDAEDIADAENAPNGRKCDGSTISRNDKRTGIACIKGIGIPTPRSRCSSPALPDKTIDLERTLAAREAEIPHWHRSSVGRNRSRRDSNLTADGFMSDLDALLRF